MTGLYPLLAALAAGLLYVLGLRRRVSKERDARVRAEIDRDQARGERELETARLEASEHARRQQAAAVAAGSEVRAEIAAAAGPAPTPEAVIAAADEARRKRVDNVKRKIAAGKGGKK